MGRHAKLLEVAVVKDGVRKGQDTLLQVAVAKHGLRKGYSVVSFILAWAIVCESLGRPITLDDYAEWWRVSESTAFREQQRFRLTFEELATPQPIVEAMQAQAGERLARRGVKDVGAFPVALLPA